MWVTGLGNSSHKKSKERKKKTHIPIRALYDRRFLDVARARLFTNEIILLYRYTRKYRPSGCVGITDAQLVWVTGRRYRFERRKIVRLNTSPTTRAKEVFLVFFFSFLTKKPHFSLFTPPGGRIFWSDGILNGNNNKPVVWETEGKRVDLYLESNNN